MINDAYEVEIVDDHQRWLRRTTSFAAGICRISISHATPPVIQGEVLREDFLVPPGLSGRALGQVPATL